MSESTGVATSSRRIERVSIISKRTTAIAVLFVVLLGSFYYFNVQAYAETLSDTAYNVVYVYGIALSVLAAIIAMWAAFKLGVKEAVGQQWLLIALSTVVFAMGDVTWTIIELGMGQDPYPSLADVFYMAQYVFFVAAIVLAIRSYRQLVNIKWPIAVGGLVAAAGVIVVYFGLLDPYILPAGVEELGTAGLIVSVGYPVMDVLFLLAPAVVLALSIGQLGAARLAWPWWVVTAGAVILAVSDSVYSYTDWAGIGSTALLDAGWIAGQMLFALGALVAMDVFRTK